MAPNLPDEAADLFIFLELHVVPRLKVQLLHVLATSQI